MTKSTSTADRERRGRAGLRPERGESCGRTAESTVDLIFENDTASTSVMSMFMPAFRQYGFLIAGGVMVLAAVLVLLLAGPVEPPE